MSTHFEIYGRLDGPRRRLARRKLADQIRATAVPYQALSDQETITQFLELEMMSYRLDLSFHETAILLGDETEADRPRMPLLLFQAFQYESRSLPKVVYAAQLAMTTMENNELKKQLEEAGLEVKKSQQIIEQLNPQHRLRVN